MQKFLLQKQLFVFLFSIISINLLSQTFVEQTSIVIPGAYYSSVAWGDYDNDGDLDFLLMGSGTVKIFRNDSGVFTDINAGLASISMGSAEWGDYDNDGDLDILITGSSKTYIYRNDSGTFTLQSGIILTGVSLGSGKWGDYDNDGDLDILLAGNSNTGAISKIYRNNGDNTFTEQTGISLIGVISSSVAWGDYDNDGNLDILLTGNNSSVVSVRGSAYLTTEGMSGSFGKNQYENPRDYFREVKHRKSVEILRHDTDRLCQCKQYPDTYTPLLVI